MPKHELNTLLEIGENPAFYHIIEEHDLSSRRHFRVMVFSTLEKEVQYNISEKTCIHQINVCITTLQFSHIIANI